MSGHVSPPDAWRKLTSQGLCTWELQERESIHAFVLVSCMGLGRLREVRRWPRSTRVVLRGVRHGILARGTVGALNT